MSMTRSEFARRYRELSAYARQQRGSGVPSADEMAALAEEAGVEWDPEPTPEPTGDLSMVRVVDAYDHTWWSRPSVGWVNINSEMPAPWSEIPQPVTVLRPEGGGHA